MSVGTAGLQKGLAAASSAVSSFQGGITNSVGKAMSGFATLGLAIDGISKAMGAITMPLSLSAEMEQTAVSFKVLLGSAQEAQTVMGDLKKFAASTPFEFPELAQAAKGLIAFGVTSKDLIPTMTRLGDVSSGLGIPLKDLSEIYGKAKVQGRLFMEDINQLQGRGINVTKEFAKQFGVTEEAVRELVSSGKINFGNLEKAFASMSGAGGQFSGMMAEQSQTMSGLWSTAKDNVTAMLTKIGDAIIKTFDLKGALSGMMVWADSVMPIFDKVLENIQSMVGAVQPYVAQFLGVVGSGLSKLTGVWSGGMSQLTGVTSVSFEGVMSVITNVMDTVTPILIQSFNIWIATQTMVANAFIAGMNAIGQAFSYVTGVVSSTFLPTWKQVKSFIQDSMIIAEFAITHWKDLTTIAFNSVVIAVLSFAGQIKHTFTTVIPAYAMWLYDNWSNILHDMGEFAGVTFYNLSNNIVKIFQNLPGLISGATDFSSIWTPLTEGAIYALKGLPEIPERVMGQMEKTLLDDNKRIKAAMEKDFGKFYDERTKQLEPPKAVIKAMEQLKAPEVAKKLETPATAPAGTGKLKLASNAEFGSKEARQSILNFAMGGDKKGKDAIADVAKTSKLQLAEQQKQTASLAKIADKAKEEILAF